MTNAEARFNKSLRPRKPEGSLGRTAQDVHLDSHTAPELCRFVIRLSDTILFCRGVMCALFSLEISRAGSVKGLSLKSTPHKALRSLVVTTCDRRVIRGIPGLHTEWWLKPQVLATRLALGLQLRSFFAPDRSNGVLCGDGL